MICQIFILKITSFFVPMYQKIIPNLKLYDNMSNDLIFIFMFDK